MIFPLPDTYGAVERFTFFSLYCIIIITMGICVSIVEDDSLTLETV